MIEKVNPSHPDKIADVVYIDKMYEPKFVEQIATRLNMDI